MGCPAGFAGAAGAAGRTVAGGTGDALLFIAAGMAGRGGSPDNAAPQHSKPRANTGRKRDFMDFSASRIHGWEDYIGNAGQYEIKLPAVKKPCRSRAFI